MLRGSEPSIEPQLLSIFQPMVKLLLLARHIPDGGDSYKRKGIRRKSQHKTHDQALEDKPYMLSHLIKFMIAKVHSVFSHALIEIFIKIVGERDGVLFRKCHHRYAKAGEVEVTHISDRSVPLVEGIPVVDN